MGLPNYNQMYKELFNAITEATNALQKATVLLQEAQLSTEETYISSKDSNIFVLPKRKNDESEGSDTE